MTAGFFTLAAGDRVGPYEVERPLGAGGMGRVYLARDTRLGRKVALKTLPPELSGNPDSARRFEQEARAASALNHPNILTVHDVGALDGALFLVTELVEGQTLRAALLPGPLPMKKAVAFAQQLAQGLAAAHAAGIVHRDLKPENVMVREDGVVKILDFGLAKLTQEPLPAAATRTDVLMGTVGYMSPEQACGEAVDFRSDQFLLGAILYEMLSGRRAFEGDNRVEVLANIVKHEPPPLGAARPDAPETLVWIVERCLAKDRADRYASTRDLAQDLERVRLRLESGSATAERAPHPRPRGSRVLLLAAAAAAVLAAGAIAWMRHTAAPASPIAAAAPALRPRALAVLPLRAEGGGEDRYLAHGIAEALMAELSRDYMVPVLSPDAAAGLAEDADPRQAAARLGASHVVDGLLERSGDRLRVSLRLTEGARELWTGQVEQPASALPALERELTARVAAALRLAPRRAARAAATRSAEAYDLYLRGRYYQRRNESPGDIDRAIALLEQAARADPAFASAHAALAASYTTRFFHLDPSPRWQEKAYVAIQKALDLDPQSPEAYVARGQLAWTLPNGFPHEAAIRDFQKAIDLDPSLVEARAHLGRVYMHVGLLDEALREWRHVLRLEPNSPWIEVRIARLHLYRNELRLAVDLFERLPPARRDLEYALALDGVGRHAEAVDFLRLAPRSGKADVSSGLGIEAVLRARAGDRAALALVARAQEGLGFSESHHVEFELGQVYALLGQPRQAVSWLRRAASEGFPNHPVFASDPDLRALRGDPAFQKLLDQIRRRGDELRALDRQWLSSS